jgi:U3 small nucleolar RNA-associated protein 11
LETINSLWQFLVDHRTQHSLYTATMSSMRNAVARRPHRERAQPESRSKWGLLEKHKDYSLRAEDYNTKKKKLTQLTTKIRDRHPDEFAYGMLSKSSAKQGKHGRGGDENTLSHDAVKLLKTQDAGYLRVALAKGRKDMKKVSEELGAAGQKEGKKTVFEDDEPAPPQLKRRRKSDAEALEDVDMNEVAYPDLPALEDSEVDDDVATAAKISKSRAKDKKAVDREKDASARLRAERKKRRRIQEVRKVRLEMLKKRQQEILAAADQLDLQRATMAKAVGGTNKNGIKFKVRERKR